MFPDGVLKAPNLGSAAVAVTTATVAVQAATSGTSARTGGSYRAASIIPMRFPVVLFDLDGTLVDSAGVILASFHHATETVLERRYPDEQILAQVGGSNLEAQMRLLAPEHVDELVRVYRAHNDPSYSEMVCFDGMVHVLQQLKGEGRRLGVVTAKRRPTVERVFEGAGIGEYFDVIVGSDATERHKPDPEPVLHALTLLGASPEDAAYVGDSPFDMAAAKGAGVFAVAVAWGGIHRVEDADVLVESPRELLGVL
jgi:pyrophosphatase PpaX